MRQGSIRFQWAALSVGCLLILTGCTPPARHQFLTFFFEGVDQPNLPVVPLPAPATNTIAAVATRTPETPAIFFHQPYVDRRCAECHVTTFSQQLRVTGEELCAGCHKKLMQKIETAKFVHRPVQKGQCLRCHDPHSGPDRYLLLRPGDALCLKCHDKEDMAEVKGHANTGNATCASCHEPHQGDQKWLPRKP